jgi:hypothetical protein
MAARKPSFVERAAEAALDHEAAEHPAVSPAPAPMNSIVSLQRAAGNRAVVGMLQRDRLPTRDPLAPRAVPGQPAANLSSTWLTALQMLRASRIEAWRKTASSVEPKPGEQVLEILISIVSEGLGGVVYGLIDKIIANKSGHLLGEFVKLAGLEAGDLAAEAIFHKALKDNQDAFQTSVKNALNKKEKSARTALALAGDGDIVDAYAELMTVHSIQEFTELSVLFSGLSGQDAAARSAALEVTYNELMSDPSTYMLELTAGFIRLLDEVTLSKKDEEHHGDRDLTWGDADMHEVEARPGNVVVFPWPRGHSLGKWSRPDLQFSGFNAAATGVNTRTLNKLRSAKIKDVPVTMSFRLKVDDPFHRIFEGDMGISEVWFTREPNGALHVGTDIDDDALEWLASYYSLSGREFDDHERLMNGMLGMQKLYDAIMDMPITQINEDY